LFLPTALAKSLIQSRGLRFTPPRIGDRPPPGGPSALSAAASFLAAPASRRPLAALRVLLLFLVRSDIGPCAACC